MGTVLTIKGADFSAKSIGKVQNIPIDFSGIDRNTGTFQTMNDSNPNGRVFIPTDPDLVAQAQAAGLGYTQNNPWAIAARYTKQIISVPEGATAVGGIFNVLTQTSNHAPYNYSPLYTYDSNNTGIRYQVYQGQNLYDIDGIEVLDEVDGYAVSGNFSILLVKGLLPLPENAAGIRWNWYLPHTGDGVATITKSLVPVGMHTPRISFIVEE